MDSNRKGNIGEAKVIAYFLENGYDVFIAFGTASKFDLIVSKDNVLQRVSIKTTASKVSKSAWNVRIKQTTRKGEMPFDNTLIDLLAVYIIPEDRVVVIDAKTVVSKFAYAIKMV